MKTYKLSFKTSTGNIDVVLDTYLNEKPEEILRRVWSDNVVFFPTKDSSMVSINMHNVSSVVITCVE